MKKFYILCLKYLYFDGFNKYVGKDRSVGLVPEFKSEQSLLPHPPIH